MATELTLNFILNVSAKGRWRRGRQTKLILDSVLYYSDVLGKVDNTTRAGSLCFLPSLKTGDTLLTVFLHRE